MKMSPDLLHLHTGMKSAEVLGPSWLGALARQTPCHESVYSRWLSFGQSPRLWSSGKTQAIHQSSEDFIRRATHPHFKQRL